MSRSRLASLACGVFLTVMGCTAVPAAMAQDSVIEPGPETGAALALGTMTQFSLMATASQAGVPTTAAQAASLWGAPTQRTRFRPHAEGYVRGCKYPGKAKAYPYKRVVLVYHSSHKVIPPITPPPEDATPGPHTKYWQPSQEPHRYFSFLSYGLKGTNGTESDLELWGWCRKPRR